VISLVFEGGVALVLVLVAGLCWRLDRRLTALRSGQDGMRSTVVELTEAATRADAAVRGLRSTSDRVGRDLDERLEQARAMADELRLLVAHAEGGASRVERKTRGGSSPDRSNDRSSGRPADRPIDPPDDRAARLLARMRGVR